MEILLLTQYDCAYCDHAKQILERLGSEYQLSFTTLDVDTQKGRALAESSGLYFAPGLYLNGELLFYGRLSERRLRRELDRRKAALPI